MLWRYQDLFLVLMESGPAQKKLSGIIINVVNNSGDGRRSHHTRSNLRFRVDRDCCLGMIAEVVDGHHWELDVIL